MSAWSLINILSFTATATPSTDNAPLASAVKVPLPLLYVQAANAAAEASLTESFTSKPFEVAAK